MGVRLDGPPPVRESRAELLSHGVLPGAVQVPDGAGPIVLAAGCQTTGGYPVIAQVATVDLPLLAQAKPGDWVRFRPIALAEAQRLDLMLERAMRVLKTAIRCRLP
jgi:antagonist of KipI